MPRIGLFEYPHLTITEAIGVAKSTPSERALGRDNGEEDRLRDLIAYGISEEREKQVKLSALGRRLTSSTGKADVAGALSEAVFHVPLLRRMWEALNTLKTESDDAFRMALITITGASLEETEQHVVEIKRLLAELPSSMKRDRSDVLGKLGEGVRAEADSAPDSVPVAHASVLEFRAGDVVKRFPFTQGGVEVMLLELNDKAFVKFLRAEAKRSAARSA